MSVPNRETARGNTAVVNTSGGEPASKKQLLVWYGQPDKYSTSFQTSQLTAALTPWFQVVPVKIRNSSRPLLRQAYRVLGNAVKPLFVRPTADYIFYANDGVADLNRASGRKIIYWYDAPWNWSEQPPNRRRQWVQWLRYRNLQAADHVFAVSRVQVEIARSLRPGREHSVSYLPVGVNCRIFDPASASPASVRERFGLPAKTIIGYLGYLGLVHGRVAGQPLIEVARRLVDLSNVHFFIVGFGPGLPVWRKMVEDLGVARHFTFSEYVPDQLVPHCLAAMDICIDTLEPGFHSEARSETKLKQYMAMGRASVATAIGENCVDLDYGKCGILVKPGTDDLFSAIHALSGDAVRRSELGAAARGRALNVYDWNILVQSFVGALEPL
jgi:glycosyltransferase involved in cell wall biosynthesis